MRMPNPLAASRFSGLPGALGATVAILFLFALAAAASADSAWDKVAEALGKAGTETPGGVYRIALPHQ